MAVSKSYENPLLGHARMRAMFRGLVETRALSEQVGKKRGLPRKLEACWVGTAIDLQVRDLASGKHASGYGLFLQAIAARKTDRAATTAEFRQAAESIAAVKPFPGAASDAVCCGIGHAMALGAAKDKGVAVVYVGVDELTPAEWKRVLAVAAEGSLPLVVVTIPATKSAVAGHDLTALAGKIAGAKIPVISVDAGDAVALYRVMQETCIRARADGGVVVIECVRCGADPVKLLGDQLLKKGICTERWIRKVEAEARALGESLQGRAHAPLQQSRRVHSRGSAG